MERQLHHPDKERDFPPRTRINYDYPKLYANRFNNLLLAVDAQLKYRKSNIFDYVEVHNE